MRGRSDGSSAGRGALVMAAALAALAAASSAPAHAEGTEPIRFELRGPAACPDEAAFVAEVQARTAKARLAAPGEVARTFRVVVTAARDGRAAQGKLTIDDPRGGA